MLNGSEIERLGYDSETIFQLGDKHSESFIEKLFTASLIAHKKHIRSACMFAEFGGAKRFHEARYNAAVAQTFSEITSMLPAKNYDYYRDEVTDFEFQDAPEII